MWTDQIDQANELADREREAMAKVRKPVMQKTGRCRECGEPVGDEDLFCDDFCRDLWMRKDRQRTIRGHAGR